MKNIDSIRTTAHFQRIYQVHDSLADKNLIVYKAEGNGKIGIICSKKVGNSVVRHHIVRLIREAYRINKEHIRKDKDIIIIARESAKGPGFTEIEKSFITLIKKHKIYNTENVSVIESK